MISNGVNALGVLEEYLNSLASWFESKGALSKDIIQISMKYKENVQKSKLSGYGFINEVLKFAMKQKLIKDSMNIEELTELIGGAILISVISWSENMTKGGLQKSLNYKYKIILQGVENE